MPEFVDIHSHISFSAYDDDREVVLKRMRDAGVSAVTVGVDLKSSEQAVELAEKEKCVFATVGLHPNNSVEESFDAGSYEDLVDKKYVVAIGECGLDYYRNDAGDLLVKRRQQDAFAAQIDFALAYDKPLMLHCRPSKKSMNAYEEVLSMLRPYAKSHGEKLRGDVHFFVGTERIAKGFLDLGFTLSFTGVVTFTRDYDEVIRYVPEDMLLSETDAPYVSPEPYRGKRNEPSHVVYVVEQLAHIRGVSLESLAPQLLQNAKRVFGFE